MFAAFRGLAFAALAGCLAAFSSCGGGSSSLPSTGLNPQGDALAATDVAKLTAAVNPPLDLGPDGRTLKPAQAVALPGSGYDELPLVTVGDEIPQLKGNFPNLRSNRERTYALPGIPDGLGLWKHGNKYFVWMNHETGATAVSKYSDTVTGTLLGSRVSLLVFDDDWACLGGKNLIRRFIDETGVIGEVSFDGATVSQTGFAANRLCSSTLSTYFGGDPIYFAGEEGTNGLPFAIYTSGDAVVINDLPRFAYENIVPVTEYRNKTVLLGMDDTADAFLVLYKGNRSGSDPNGFLSGTSYVAAVKVNGVVQANAGALVNGPDYDVQWIEVPRTYNSTDPYNSQSALYAWASTVGTKFMRPEDAHEDPDNEGKIYFVTTGRTGTYDPYGRTWRLDLHNSNPTDNAELRLLTVAGPGVFFNPDNICIDTNGKFWIQEDPSGTQALMLGEGRRSSIYTTNRQGHNLMRLFEVTQDNTLFAGNPWETSGIVQVPGRGRNGTGAVLFDTQAHGMADPDYVEGGQLILGVPQRSGNGHGGGNGNGHGHGWFDCDD